LVTSAFAAPSDRNSENQRMAEGKSLLIAAAFLLGGFLLAVILFSADLPFLGMVAAFTAIPLAFVAWVMAADRYY
jgi:hypothetical protein